MGWFRKNETVVNSGKFQAIIINRKEVQAKHKLIIDKEIKTINKKNSKITRYKYWYEQITGYEHISILCS